MEVPQPSQVSEEETVPVSEEKKVQYPRYPVRGDFIIGPLALTTLPFKPPVPRSITNYIYGENHPPLSQQDHIKLLTQLYEIMGFSVAFCPCGDMLAKTPIIDTPKLIVDETGKD